MCKFQFTIKPLSSSMRRQCTLRCNFHIPYQRTGHAGTPRDANQFGIHDGVVLSSSIDIYLTFPNSKDIIPRTDYPTMRCATVPSLTFILRTCGQEPVINWWVTTRLWREINRQHIYMFQIPWMFRTAHVSLYLDPSSNYGYSIE